MLELLVHYLEGKWLKLLTLLLSVALTDAVKATDSKKLSVVLTDAVKATDTN